MDLSKIHFLKVGDIVRATRPIEDPGSSTVAPYICCDVGAIGICINLDAGGPCWPTVAFDNGHVIDVIPDEVEFVSHAHPRFLSLGNKWVNEYDRGIKD